MQTYQSEFLQLALEKNVLRFGEYTLKSGRVSPYFFNAGLFNTGSALLKLGEAYAMAAIQSRVEFDMLFGPAYKGITLAATTSISMARNFQRDLPYAYNRKEAKTHGEAGLLVGADLRGRVLIVDDVITAGTSVRESVDIIRSQGATPAGVLIAIDRQERGTDSLRSAADDVESEYGIPVIAITNLAVLMEFVSNRDDLVQHRDRLMSYRMQYGVPT